MQTKAPSSTSLIGNGVPNQSWMPSDDLIAYCYTTVIFFLCQYLHKWFKIIYFKTNLKRY